MSWWIIEGFETVKNWKVLNFYSDTLRNLLLLNNIIPF